MRHGTLPNLGERKGFLEEVKSKQSPEEWVEIGWGNSRGRKEPPAQRKQNVPSSVASKSMMRWENWEVEITAGFDEPRIEWIQGEGERSTGDDHRTQVSRLGTLHFISSMMFMLWRLPRMGMWDFKKMTSYTMGHEPENRVPGLVQGAFRRFLQ